MSDKLNVVLIMADQLAGSALGAFGNPVVRTPNIDRLAENGAIFTNCYCNSPLCAPSRASLLTGTRVLHNGVYDNGAELPAGIPTFVHHLRRAGYETVLSGKMHFIGPDQLHGFEYRLTTDIYPASMNWTPDWGRGTYPTSGGTSVKRVKASGPCTWNKQLAYDEEVLYRTLEHLRHYGEGESDKPLFLCASFTHPHDPFIIPEEYWNLYKDAPVPAPSAPPIPFEQMHPYDQWIQIHHESDRIALTEQEVLNARKAYYGMVTYFDGLVGKITNELSRLGLSDNTMIIVVSDHGEMLGEHGMWYKRTYFDPAAKVPLIMSCPAKFESGRTLNQVVSLVDLSATIMDICQVPDFSEWEKQIDGDSYLGILMGDETAWKNTAICEYFGEGSIHAMIAIRQVNYKYVYVHGQQPRLFDLRRDPHEITDLSGDARYASILESFYDRFLGHLDFDQLERTIRSSQANRMLVSEALKKGDKAAWDYQPFFDASQSYYR